MNEFWIIYGVKCHKMVVNSLYSGLQIGLFFHPTVLNPKICNLLSYMTNITSRTSHLRSRKFGIYCEKLAQCLLNYQNSCSNNFLYCTVTFFVLQHSFPRQTFFRKLKFV